MKSKRIKKPVIVLASRVEAEEVMTELASALNNQRSIQAQRDAAILAINKSFEAPLADCDALISEKHNALQVWATANPTEFPKDRKSLEMLSGTLGFRKGTPKLATLNRSWTWVKILAALRASKALAFIRTVEEVNKEAMLAEHAASEKKSDVDALYKNVGVKVTQEESFFVEAKLADTTARQTSEVAA